MSYISVLFIRDRAFKSCKSLTEVNIPQVQEIGQRAFAGCERLTTVITSDHLGIIDKEAFSCCKNLKKINISGLESLKKKAFFYSGLTEISIPISIKEVGDGVFFAAINCTKLKYPIIFQNL